MVGGSACLGLASARFKHTKSRICPVYGALSRGHWQRASPLVNPLTIRSKKVFRCFAQRVAIGWLARHCGTSGRVKKLAEVGPLLVGDRFGNRLPAVIRATALIVAAVAAGPVGLAAGETVVFAAIVGGGEARAAVPAVADDVRWGGLLDGHGGGIEISGRGLGVA